MAKFYGEVGYAETVETNPGVYKEVVTERPYYGDVTRASRLLKEGEDLHGDISISNSISIVADAYAYDHIFAIRYVRWAGTLWTISNVEVKSPRLILQVGKVYNGPRP